MTAKSIKDLKPNDKVISCKWVERALDMHIRGVACCCNGTQFKLLASTDEIYSGKVTYELIVQRRKELFEAKEINHVDSYDYKYDASKNSYIKKNEVENVDKISIIKITKIDNQKDYKEIEYYYTYLKDGSDMDVRNVTSIF